MNISCTKTSGPLSETNFIRHKNSTLDFFNKLNLPIFHKTPQTNRMSKTSILPSQVKGAQLKKETKKNLDLLHFIKSYFALTSFPQMQPPWLTAEVLVQ